MTMSQGAKAGTLDGRVLSKPVDDLSPRACVLLCILGIVVIASVWRTNLIVLDGVHDFTGFLVGSKLLGSPYLYEVPANLAAQKALTGYTAPGVIFVRLPFWAFVMKPFTWIDYRFALVTWKLLMIGALIAFPLCLPSIGRKYVALTLCWSLPLANAIAISNDSPLVLLFIALSLLAWRSGKPMLAGLALGLCLAKFHFLIFLPLLLFQRKYWRVLAGFSIPAIPSLAINFWVQPAWINLFWRALHLPQENMNATPAHMPNFYSAFFETGLPEYGVILGFLTVPIALWPICRRLPFEFAMPLCITGAVLAAPHTNNFDSILTIPAFFMVAKFIPDLRFPAILLISPAAGFVYLFGPASWGSAAFVGLSLWVMLQLGWSVRKSRIVLPTEICTAAFQ